MTWLRTLRGQLALVLAAPLLLLAPLGPVQGDPPKKDPAPATKELDKEHLKTIEVLADYLTGPFDRVSPELEKLGYEPPVAADLWREYPPVRKIATAYASYENAEPGVGGDKFLALLSRSMAQQYGPIAADAEPRLKKYKALLTTNKELAQHVALLAFMERNRPDDPPPPPPLTFKHPPPDKPPMIGPEARSAIMAVAELSAHGPLGTTSYVFQKYFGLTEDQSFNIMYQSRTKTESYVRAFSAVPEEKRNGVLETLIPALVAKMEPARDEKAFARYLKKPPEPPVAARSEHPTPPDRGGGGSEAEKAWHRAIEQDYDTPKKRNFEDMGKRVRDFGGGVFGNIVSATDELVKRGKVVSLTFGKGKVGDELRVRFRDDSELVFSPVLAEDAFAAHQMVFGKIKDRQWAPGEGIGIVGVTVVGNYEVYAPKGIQEYFVSTVLLHPAVVDTELGYSAVLADTLPSSGQDRLLAGAEKQLGADGRAALRALFASRKRQFDRPNYIITDVPLEFFKDNDHLRVRRPAEGKGRPEFPEGIRRHAYIEMRLMLRDEEQFLAKAQVGPGLAGMFQGPIPYLVGINTPVPPPYDEKFAQDFYHHVPLLIRASSDFQRINQFAAILALFRWAKMNGAVCKGMPDSPPKKVGTPDALLEGLPNADRKFTTLRPIQLKQEMGEFDPKKAKAIGFIRKDESTMIVVPATEARQDQVKRIKEQMAKLEEDPKEGEKIKEVQKEFEKEVKPILDEFKQLSRKQIALAKEGKALEDKEKAKLTDASVVLLGLFKEIDKEKGSALAYWANLYLKLNLEEPDENK